MDNKYISCFEDYAKRDDGTYVFAVNELNVLALKLDTARKALDSFEAFADDVDRSGCGYFDKALEAAYAAIKSYKEALR